MTLIIKDLPQSDDLDRQAMRSILGGARIGIRPVRMDEPQAASGRIVDYPPGLNCQGPVPAKS